MRHRGWRVRRRRINELRAAKKRCGSAHARTAHLEMRTTGAMASLPGCSARACRRRHYSFRRRVGVSIVWRSQCPLTRPPDFTSTPSASTTTKKVAWRPPPPSLLSSLFLSPFPPPFYMMRTIRGLVQRHVTRLDKKVQNRKVCIHIEANCQGSCQRQQAEAPGTRLYVACARARISKPANVWYRYLFRYSIIFAGVNGEARARSATPPELLVARA